MDESLSEEDFDRLYDQQKGRMEFYTNPASAYQKDGASAEEKKESIKTRLYLHAEKTDGAFRCIRWVRHGTKNGEGPILAIDYIYPCKPRADQSGVDAFGGYYLEKHGDLQTDYEAGGGTGDYRDKLAMVDFGMWGSNPDTGAPSSSYMYALTYKTSEAVNWQQPSLVPFMKWCLDNGMNYNMQVLVGTVQKQYLHQWSMKRPTVNKVNRETDIDVSHYKWAYNVELNDQHTPRQYLGYQRDLDCSFSDESYQKEMPAELSNWGWPTP